VREAIFSILGNDLGGTRVLDLFAGTGAMGLEALSRGAALVVLVDHHPPALRLIARNLATLGASDEQVTIKRFDLGRGLSALAREGSEFDLIFLDPPYHLGLGGICLQDLGRGTLLAPRAVVVSEQAVDEQRAPAYGCLHLQDIRRYGSTAVAFYHREQK
jgi:16S rRNA (guanine966-N2)-methyltransferase